MLRDEERPGVGEANGAERSEAPPGRRPGRDCDISTSGYLAKAELSDLCAELGLTEVPAVFERELPATIDEILELAEGKSALAPETEREGLVWVHGAKSKRVSFKAISNRFLTLGGS
jgi:hypothetical protein